MTTLPSLHFKPQISAMRLLILFTLGIALAIPRICEAAEIRLSDGRISISGPIAKGDYRKVAAFVIDPSYPERLDAFLGAVDLNSPGGDVAEAIKIAGLLDQSFAYTSVRKGGSCASACFLLWSAGVRRVNSGTLGVHRLSWTSPSTDVRRTESAVIPAAQTVEAFLLKMGIPRRILEKMSETAPSDLFVVSDRWLIEQDIAAAVGERPTFLDVAEKKCGTNPNTIAMRVNRRIDSRAFAVWDDCADDVRVANQTMHMKEIIGALKEASIR